MTMTLSGAGGASLTPNGYAYLPNGLILQWGSTTTVANSSVNITFPVQFPNACQNVTVSGTYGGADYAYNVTAKSNTGATIFHQGSAVACYWMAIGY